MLNWKTGEENILSAIPLAIDTFPNADPAQICYLVTEFWLRTEWYAHLAGGHLPRTCNFVEEAKQGEIELLEAVLSKTKKIILAKRKELINRFPQKYQKYKSLGYLFSTKLKGRLNAMHKLPWTKYYLLAQRKKLEDYQFFNIPNFRRFVLEERHTLF